MAVRKCQMCGLEFEAKQHNTACCSNQCATRLWRGRGGKEQRRAPLPCQACGRAFVPKRANGTCCSPACQHKGSQARNADERRAYARARQKATHKPAPPPAELACARCGATFRGRTGAKFCSPRCANAGFAAANKERRAEYLRAYKRAARAAACHVPARAEGRLADEARPRAAAVAPGAEALVEACLARGPAGYELRPGEAELLELFFGGKPGAADKHVLHVEG